MIERIIEWCAKNRFFVFLGTALAIVWSIWAINNIPLDAIPDLTDTQVIIYSKWDRPPQIIEDQITYPIVSALLGAPKVKDIRGFSDYGFSYVYVVFEDGTDVYWARSRVLEYLSKITAQLPQDAAVELGPDATGVGWVYEYALIDETGKHSLDELRTFQDWHLKYALQSVKGVAEVASVGGFSKQYQIVVNPNALLAYNISISDIIMAVKKSNQEIGARLLELSGTEYMVTVKGYIKSKKDIEEAVIKVTKNGVPIRIKELANVQIGPDIRRGVAELNGEGEVVGGIVVMRYKENALDVIKNVKKKFSEIQLPEGVKVVVTYDRSDLIIKSIDTMKKKLLEEMIVVAIIILIFLLHIPSAIIPIITLPIAALISFIPMYYMNLTSNVMSLGGIAIAIGAMVDASIVVVENSHKKLSHWEESGRKGDYHLILINAIKEVGRPSFFSLLVISVAFIPIFTLEGIEGRLFKPLAYTKNFAMLFAAVLAITLDPAIRMLFTKIDDYVFKPKWLCKITNFIFVGKIRSEEKHAVSKFLFKIYGPVVDFVLKKPYLIISSALILFIITIPIYFKIGSEFMPPLDEGSILYMPTTLPGISVTEATKLLQVQDKILKSFPEVVSVFGKAGRANTSTDPAPFSMMETTVILKSEKEWRSKKRWYSKIAPEFIKRQLRLIWSDRISREELITEMDEKLKLPGQVNAWTLPIKGRIDMLTTGIRTPVGIKIYGDDLEKIQEIGTEIETHIKSIKGTRSVYAERTAAGYFVNINIKRDEIARYGLTIEDVQMVLMSAVGGENISQTIEGRERFGINVRYPRELRDDVEKLKRIYIATPTGAQIPVIQIADIKIEKGPGMIRDENGRLSGYVYVDVANRDIGGYVTEVKKMMKEMVELPAGYSLIFSGQYEFMERVKKRMFLVVPLTLFIIFVLLYINTKSYTKTFIVLLAVPFSLIGVVWILYLLNYNLSIGVWAGIIALLGIDAETGVFMLLYLDLSYNEMKEKGQMRTLNDLKQAIHYGAVKRIRPKMMTVLTTFIGLLPIMWAQTFELGADVMKRIAAPMVGGIFTSFLMELLVYPAIYLIWRHHTEIKKQQITDNY
ncbi:MAG TPA: CusA/CzcA family heavy metal efflux RND transporter [Elusimicrobia bacterium]|nr:MAG: cation transporter [Elusimicrobia bacterium RIFOXYD2_FULL_34_30]HAM38597.1 CusA/CzcA family heavy metal efflux RND transporter [Elusimicrobiota bacterium]